MNQVQYKKLLELELINFKPWKILLTKVGMDYSKELKKRYPNRELIPFAVRTDCDDVACWDLSKSNSNKVYIIHDFASVGWEQQEVFENFENWLKYALDVMFNFD